MPEWSVRRVRTAWAGEAISVEVADVALPDGREIEHQVVRVAFDIVSVVVRDEDDRLLMLWRHRFITKRWAWDVPAGKIADGEEPTSAAVRAAVDETGWRPREVRVLGAFHASPGISDQRFVVCLADGADKVGPADPNEADRVEWLPAARVRELAVAGDLDGLSLTSVLWATA